MAFRRKRAFHVKRKIRASAIPKSIARVRKQRIVVFNTMQACEHTCFEPNETCTSRVVLSLMRNGDLQTLFGDNVKIVSMQGSIYVDPLWVLPYQVTGVPVECGNGQYGVGPAWLAFMNIYSRSIWQWRAGMIKTYSTSVSPASPTPDYNVDNSFDWSEPGFMKRWEKLWFFREELGIDHMVQGALYGVCGTSNVSKPNTGALVNALAAGTGNINTETGAITTVETCTPFGQNTDLGPLQRSYRTVRQPAPFRMSVNTRRPIQLKENENLEIQCAFSTLFPGPDCFPGEVDDCMLDCMGGAACTIRLIPNITMTLQYG